MKSALVGLAFSLACALIALGAPAAASTPLSVGGSSHVAQAPTSPDPVRDHSADGAASASTVLPARLDPTASPSHSAALGDTDRSEQADIGTASLTAQAPYNDVASSNTHHDDILALAGRGVFDGTDCGAGRFCPDDPIDRATMAVWVVRILDGQDPPPGPSSVPRRRQPAARILAAVH